MRPDEEADELRYLFNSGKAADRMHIQEGLKIRKIVWMRELLGVSDDLDLVRADGRERHGISNGLTIRKS